MSDLTTDILVDIRNELRGANERLDRTNDRLERTNDRLDRVVQEQIRHSTAIVSLEHRVANAIDGLSARIDNVLVGGMGQTVREHEARLQRVEEHLGLATREK